MNPKQICFLLKQKKKGKKKVYIKIDMANRTSNTFDCCFSSFQFSNFSAFIFVFFFVKKRNQIFFNIVFQFCNMVQKRIKVWVEVDESFLSYILFFLLVVFFFGKSKKKFFFLGFNFFCCCCFIFHFVFVYFEIVFKLKKTKKKKVEDLITFRGKFFIMWVFQVTFFFEFFFIFI